MNIVDSAEDRYHHEKETVLDQAIHHQGEHHEPQHDKIEDIDLSADYPRSKISILRNWFPYLGIFLIIFIIGSYILISLDYVELSPHVRSFFSAVCERFMTFALLITLGALVYQILYYLTYKYQIVNEALVLSKGVIWRVGSSLPLRGVSDIELNKNFGDLLFGLQRMQLTSSSPNRDGSLIDGLSSDTATKLRDFILSIAGKSVQNSQEHEQQSSPGEGHSRSNDAGDEQAQPLTANLGPF